MSLNQWALKNGTSFFLEKTQLVSTELEIEILRWSRLITLNLYRMEPPASSQIATGTPLKNASVQTLKTHNPNL